MPSPFPGMNPYFEQDEVWHDFHQSIILRMRESLVRQVKSRYIVKLEMHRYIRDLSFEKTGPASKDVYVLEESFIEVCNVDSRQLVTTIVLLSPISKSERLDQEPNLVRRRQDLLDGTDGTTNYVELDLLRGGIRLPLVPVPHCDYYALAVRAEQRSDVEAWPIQLRDPLPVISVPLLPGDADGRLDLQQLLHATYDAGGYQDFIYEDPPSPALTGADAEWAAGIVARVH